MYWSKKSVKTVKKKINVLIYYKRTHYNIIYFAWLLIRSRLYSPAMAWARTARNINKQYPNADVICIGLTSVHRVVSFSGDIKNQR